MDEVNVTDVNRKMIQVGNKRYIAEYFATGKEKYLCRAEEVNSGHKIGWTEVESHDPAFAFGDEIKKMF